MKKLFALLAGAVLLSACSMEEVFLIPTTTPTPAATSTIAPTDAPTFTPTIATSTFTPTPTLAGRKSETPTFDFTPTLVTATHLVLITPNTPTPKVDIQGFVAVFTSQKEFFKSGACEPTTVKFTAQAANPSGTAFVVLFVRFKSKQTGATSEWTSITMETLIPGTFVHDLVADEMKAVDSFRNSWVQYQFVATNSKRQEIGRTGVFAESLSVSECIPTPTVTITPTPSALVP